MSERPTPVVPEGPARAAAERLTPETVEDILADFRTWIERASATGTLPADAPAGEPLDLHTLLAQFTALRHEVNLQTKAVRAQQEQNAETLQQYRAALEALQADQAAARDPEDLLRPLLKNVVDAYDALALARREVERVRTAVLPMLQRQAAPGAAASPGFWARLFGRTAPAESGAVEAAGRIAAAFDSVLTGYTMSLQRLERTLQQCDLEPIPSIGQPFDPELMEVVEVAGDSGLAPNEVIDEVRRGYLWRGRVFRYAQVRVAKP